MRKIPLIALLLLLGFPLPAFPDQMHGIRRDARDSQMPAYSAQCPTGGPEAVTLFELGNDYHYGRLEGRQWDRDKAARYYEEAARLGNARALIELGNLYRANDTHFTRVHPKKARHAAHHIYRDLAADLYLGAWEMGCPEGLGYLADDYYSYRRLGWSVHEQKAVQLLGMAAYAGSLQDMVAHGASRWKEASEQGKPELYEEGKAFMERALALGYGYAGVPLSVSYSIKEGNIEDAIRVLRAGAALGSTGCLYHLAEMYRPGSRGVAGQKKDEAYAKQVLALKRGIDDNYDPKPIANFDRLLPPKPIRSLPAKEPLFRGQAGLKIVPVHMQDEHRNDARFSRAQDLWRQRMAESKDPALAGKVKPPSGKNSPPSVYGQLEARNRCYQPVQASLSQAERGGHLASRSIDKLLLWSGEKPPKDALAFTKGQGKIQLSVRETTASAKPRALDFAAGRVDIWDLTLCPGEPALDDPVGLTERPAIKGEKLDFYAWHFTQIPGSFDAPYRKYPVNVFFEGIHVASLRTGSDKTKTPGDLHLFFPAGTRGKLELLGGPAIGSFSFNLPDYSDRWDRAATGKESVIMPAKPRLGPDAF